MAKKSNKPKKSTRQRKPPASRDDGVRHIIDEVTGKPRPATPEEIEMLREHSRQREARRKEWEADRRARLNRRPVEMQRSDYELPADVVRFLMSVMGPISFPTITEPHHHMTLDAAASLGFEMYRKGCKQGFIEGFLYGEEKARPGAMKNRERLRQQNLEKLARLGIEDRNAGIIAEFHRLARELPGKEQRYERLAEKYELTTRQICNIVRGKNGRTT
jgi:hypothetical protein